MQHLRSATLATLMVGWQIQWFVGDLSSYENLKKISEILMTLRRCCTQSLKRSRPNSGSRQMATLYTRRPWGSPVVLRKLSLPRCVPLAYRLDTNMKPLPREDGKLDYSDWLLTRYWWRSSCGGYTGTGSHTSSVWYDTSIAENLETSIDSGRKHRQWTDLAATQKDGWGCTVTGRMPHLGECESLMKVASQ